MANNGEGASAKSPRDGGGDMSKKDVENRQKVLGDRLRRLFDDVVDEPVPDDFLKLLEEADSASQEEDAKDKRSEDGPE